MPCWTCCLTTVGRALALGACSLASREKGTINLLPSSRQPSTSHLQRLREAHLRTCSSPPHLVPKRPRKKKRHLCAKKKQNAPTLACLGPCTSLCRAQS